MLEIGTDLYLLSAEGGSNERHNALNRKLQDFVGGHGNLHKDAAPWVRDKIEKGYHKYNSFEDMVEAMEKEHVLVLETSNRGLGPKTIGKRPNFVGEAAKMEAPDRHDRRHVISASTLGKAAEKSPGSLQEINQFLERNGGTACETEKQARREAWRMINSHKGNLWPGPRGDNRAAGFIRGPLHDARENAQKNNGQLPKEDIDALNRTLSQRPQGPLYKDGQESWKAMGTVMGEMINDQQSRRQGEGVPPGGNAADQDLVEDLHELEKNADLDLPDIDMQGNKIEMGGTDYFEQLTDIYADIRTVSEHAPSQDGEQEPELPNLFIENGTLDRYMKLDLHKINEVRAQAQQQHQQNNPNADQGPPPPGKMLAHMPPHPGRQNAPATTTTTTSSHTPSVSNNNNSPAPDAQSDADAMEVAAEEQAPGPTLEATPPVALPPPLPQPPLVQEQPLPQPPIAQPPPLPGNQADPLTVQEQLLAMQQPQRPPGDQEVNPNSLRANYQRPNSKKRKELEGERTEQTQPVDDTRVQSGEAKSRRLR